MLKKIEDNLKRASEYTNGEIIKISKEQVKLEKAMDKKINGLDQKLEKQEDFFVQKLDFVKMEIESDMANKTTKMLEQKSKA